MNDPPDPDRTDAPPPASPWDPDDTWAPRAPGTGPTSPPTNTDPPTPDPTPRASTPPLWSTPEHPVWSPAAAWPPPPVSPPAGGGGPVPHPGWWSPPPEPPRRTKGASRLVAALVALALVVASAGLGAIVALAFEGRQTTRITLPALPAFPTDPVRPGGGATGAIDADAIAKRVVPSTVNIMTTMRSGESAGTGIIISDDGFVLTNNHVIADSTNVKVDVGGRGDIRTATVLGYDVADDVALLKLADPSDLRPARIGDTDRVRVGDPVVAIGNQLGQGTKVTQGKVTGLNQDVTAGDGRGGRTETLRGMIQIDAPIKPGNSGGPLVDADGRVIGINTAASGRGLSVGVNIGFAIPIERAIGIADQIRRGDESDGVHIGPRALLGVSVQPADDVSFGSPPPPVDRGALVVEVADPGAAQDVGIESGSVIVEVDGRSVGDDDELRDILGEFDPGDRVRVTWVDPTGERRSGTARLREGPPA
ncbi:MAG: S1C family serine protease [Actinomycetota bacterium]